MDSKLYINPPLVDRAYHWEGKKQPRTRKELDTFFKSAAIRKVKQQICEHYLSQRSKGEQTPALIFHL